VDKFKQCQHKGVGIGGLYCQCCNDYYGADKAKLNRAARARLKEDTKKEIKQQTQQEEE